MPAERSVLKSLEQSTVEKNSGVSSESETLIEEFSAGDVNITRYVNEFWTSRQRQASSIHEISYRACFKPQLPRFFINLLTIEGELVYDPFAGRGTTAIETALMGRKVIANDVNPLSRILSEPRLSIPHSEDIKKRLSEIPFDQCPENELDLSMFYHPGTEAELLALRTYLTSQEEESMDFIDRWIRMIATNRLTGHSKGFFSVYTMPPNQAVSAERQKLINSRRDQQPEYRDVKNIIIKKTGQLTRNLTSDQVKRLRKAAENAVFLADDASDTKTITAKSIDLIVTSPPFLDVVQYSADNWLRCWFNNIDLVTIDKQITMAKTLEEWKKTMSAVFNEFYRILKPGGWIAFEVGEVRKGRLRLEEEIIPLGIISGFDCAGIVINRQTFTKTSNIWGVKNNCYGTNSNRIALFNKKLQG